MLDYTVRLDGDDDDAIPAEEPEGDVGDEGDGDDDPDADGDEASDF